MTCIKTEDTEIRDRIRRIETRLTVLAKGLGIEVGGASVLWNANAERIQISTPNCSLAEVLRAIPPHLQGENADVYVGCKYFATLSGEIHKPKLRMQSLRDERQTHAGQ